MLTSEQNREIAKWLEICWHTLIFYFDDGTVKCSCGRMFRCPDEGTFHVEQENNIPYDSWDGFRLIMENGPKNREQWWKFVEDRRGVVFMIERSSYTHIPDSWSVRQEFIGPPFAGELIKWIEGR